MFFSCYCGGGFEPTGLDGKGYIKLGEAREGDVYTLSTGIVECPKCGTSCKVSVSLEMLEIESASDKEERLHYQKIRERMKRKKQGEADNKVIQQFLGLFK